MCSLEAKTAAIQAVPFNVDVDLLYTNASGPCLNGCLSGINITSLVAVQTDIFADATAVTFPGFPVTPFAIAPTSTMTGAMRASFPASALAGTRTFDVTITGNIIANGTPVVATCSACIELSSAYIVEGLGGISNGELAGNVASRTFRFTNLTATPRTINWVITSTQTSSSTTADHFPIALCGNVVPPGNPMSTVNPTLNGIANLPGGVGQTVDVCFSTASYMKCHTCSNNKYDIVATDQTFNVGKARTDYLVLAPCWTGIAIAPPTPLASYSSAGAAIPQSGSGGGGVWPNTLPPAASTTVVTVVVPAIPVGAVLTAVKLTGLTHTFVGDLQFVLTDPFGGQHNLLHRPGFTGGGFGSSCSLNGDYTIVESGATVWPACAASLVPGGIYDQLFGNWPSGTVGIQNTALNSIFPTTGVWTLTVYDWAGGDIGAFTSWALCFGLRSGDCTHGSNGANSYCVSGPSFNGCVPVMTTLGIPDASAGGGFQIAALSVDGQRQGTIYYGLAGQQMVVWSPTAFLCVKAPVTRGACGLLSSGGTAGLCNGVLAIDWNAYIQNPNNPVLGGPFMGGETVQAQAWYRDPPSLKTTHLSNAVQFTVLP